MPSAFCVCKVTEREREKKKKASWDERMSAASLEDDDVVLHADADPEVLPPPFPVFSESPWLVSGFSFARFDWLRPSVPSCVGKSHCILLTFSECFQCDDVL